MGYRVEGKLDVQNAYLKDPTGFTDPANVVVTYNPTTRKITLTGTVLAYWQGNVIPVLTSGWVSSAHDDTVGKWFLYYNGSTFVWSNNVWTFDMLMIALVIYETTSTPGPATGWALREPHGFMPKETHQELHEQVGTYSRSGNNYTSASFTLSSTTAANRRPLIDAGIISDEDVPTTIAALLSASYARVSLGVGLAFSITTGSSDIVNLNGNQPYYNSINTGTNTGIQVLMNNNEYQKLFIVAVPVTSEAYSQARRHLIFQGQTVSTNLATIQGVTFKSLNKGTFGSTITEFVPIIEIIIRYTAGNWQLIEVNNVVENRSTSITTTGLTTVATNNYLTGNGTSLLPLGINGTGTPYAVLHENNTGTALQEDAKFLFDSINDRMVIGSSNVATKGTFEAVIEDIQLTDKVGLALLNPTAALVGTTIQYSPGLIWQSAAWDTDGAVSVQSWWRLISVPVNGNTVIDQLLMQTSNNGSTWITIATLQKLGSTYIVISNIGQFASQTQTPTVRPITDTDLVISTTSTTDGKKIKFTANNTAIELGNITTVNSSLQGIFNWFGRFELKQGTDVVSATNITLPTDGNAFNITGTNTIDSILSTNWQSGSRVTLKFSSTCPISHLKSGLTGSNRQINLSCGTDYTTKINQVLEFELRSDNIWYEIGESSVVVTQSSYWNNLPGTITRVSDTQFTIPDTGNALKLDKILSKGTVLKWDNSGTKVAMVSSATYATNTVTVNILGEPLAVGFTNVKYTKDKAFELRFKYNGLFSTAFTDCMATTYCGVETRALAMEFRCTAGSGGSGNLVLDINDDGVSFMTIKPTLANTTASYIATVNPSTIIAEGSKITVDIDSVLTTPTTYHSDGELILYYLPNNNIYF